MENETSQQRVQAMNGALTVIEHAIEHLPATDMAISILTESWYLITREITLLTKWGGRIG